METFYMRLVIPSNTSPGLTLILVALSAQNDVQQMSLSSLALHLLFFVVDMTPFFLSLAFWSIQLELVHKFKPGPSYWVSCERRAPYYENETPWT
ncbi:hypothetical protein DL96DRAFT_1641941 [Flagelloscypha sp. PMI_526]|nr:hypothetical protein DL96DRAFT_1641941 [Flagelloscypha sp. PMI_526]